MPWFRPAILLLSALLVMACFSAEVSDSDTFFHLRMGKYISQNHKLPVPDPFSWASYVGKPAYTGEEHTRYFNLTHEWLLQWLFYAIYSVGGYGGMVLVRACLVVAICAGIFVIVQRRTAHFELSLAASLLFVAVQYATPFLDRPVLYSTLLLVAVLVLLEYRRYLWLLPVVFLFWGNMHGGYVMGWVALGAHCAEDLWLRRRGRPAPGSRTLWIACTAAILVTGLNPNGFRALQVLLFYQQSELQSRLMEWTPPALWPPQEMFTIVLYAAGLTLLLARAKVRPADWLLYLLFALAAARASRNIVFIALIGPIVIAAYFPWKRAVTRIAPWILAGAVLVALPWQFARGHAFELHEAAWRYPVGPAAFLEKHNVVGRMLNSHASGGYLMWRLWPLQRTMIDGRSLNETAFRDATRIIDSRVASDGLGPSFDQLLDQYGIEVIVTEGFEYYSGRPWWLAVNLATLRQDTWKLVYRDPTGVVFMRNPPPGVTPLFPPDALRSFEDQCTEHLARDPQWPGCASGLARVFAGLQDLPRARRWAVTYLEYQKNPDPADVEAVRQLQ